MTRTIWLVLTLLFASAPALARDATDDVRTRLEAANAELSTLETHEHADEAALEFGQARLEVAEVQGKLSASDYAGAATVLNRLEARLDLINATLERVTVEVLADQRETDLYAMQTEADEKQIELESAQLRRQQLQDEVTVIVEQMNAEN